MNMNRMPSYEFEAKAAEDRQRLHSSVTELRSCLSEVIDIRRNTRKHLGVACSFAALLGLGLGYSVTSIFVHD